MEFSPKRTTKNRNTCRVHGCTSRANKNRTVRFHKFPQKGSTVKMHNKLGQEMLCDRREAWILALNNNPNVITPFSVVCSLHFDEQDYIGAQRQNVGKRVLKSNAVPKNNLPATSVHGKFMERTSKTNETDKTMHEREEQKSSASKRLFEAQSEDARTSRLQEACSSIKQEADSDAENWINLETVATHVWIKEEPTQTLNTQQDQNFSQISKSAIKLEEDNIKQLTQDIKFEFVEC